MKKLQLSLPVVALALAVLPTASSAQEAPRVDSIAGVEFDVASDIAEFGFSEFDASPVAEPDASPAPAESARVKGTKVPRVTGTLGGVKDTTDSVPICVDLPWGTTLCCTPKSCVVF